MEGIYIVGVGMTPFGKLLDRSVKDLTREAVAGALADASCTIADLEAVQFSNACQGHMQGQDLIRGEIALRSMGIEGIPVTNVENACASASTAVHGAVQFLRAGMGEVALAVGVEKMYSTDRARMFSAFDSGWDVETAEKIDKEPTWPKESFEQLLKLGFADRIVDNEDHHYVRRLRGIVD